jgi:hypothetical protein
MRSKIAIEQKSRGCSDEPWLNLVPLWRAALPGKAWAGPIKIARRCRDLVKLLLAHLAKRGPMTI